MLYPKQAAKTLQHSNIHVVRRTTSSWGKRRNHNKQIL